MIQTPGANVIEVPVQYVAVLSQYVVLCITDGWHCTYVVEYGNQT